MSRHDVVLRAKAGTTLRSTTERISRAYGLATKQQIAQGTNWYRDSAGIVADLAVRASISNERAAVVVAHMSPQTTWARNVTGAYELCLSGRAPGYCLSTNVARATEALKADDPWSTFGRDAHKTRRFARNLLHDTEAVTVDIWAVRVALGCGWGKRWRTGEDDHLELIIGRAGVYQAIERAYQLAALRHRVEPTAMQATTWIVARNGRSA